ncbi:hypothetical protein HCG77_28960 [Rhodococcus qingshengii]|nr:hypothetical protein [Rhodococcus qingshengii]
MLVEAGSAWKVGVRAGRLGLEKRVPEGVQVAAESTFAITGNAGRQLAEAWAAAFGVDPDPSKAYSRAVKAVEDAAIPVVSPLNGNATLGTVIRDIENQGDHKLPMTREHPNAIQGDVLVGMLRVLWVGQHDRHGNSALPPVSQEEAEAAVVLAVTLVDWFATGKIKRRKKI